MPDSDDAFEDRIGFPDPPDSETPATDSASAEPRHSMDREQVIAELKSFGRGRSLENRFKIGDLIKEGRRL